MLVIGFGNVSRRDDGVALHVLRRFARRLGWADALAGGESEVQLASGLTVAFAHQLVPELAVTVAKYDLVVFVDAHVASAGWDDVHWQSVPVGSVPAERGHRGAPATVMAVARTVCGHEGLGYVLSVLGTDFDFGEELSPETSARADEAVERLLTFTFESGLARG